LWENGIKFQDSYTFKVKKDSLEIRKNADKYGTII